MSIKSKAWIGALRLRTLPLAAGGIILGSFLPEVQLAFSWTVFALALLTAFGLQILSNLANDYGDFVKGTDNEQRVGPQRALQSGAISKGEMKKALFLCGGLTLASGIALLALSFGPEQMTQALWMLGVGLVAIWAAIQYTVGKRAYGYSGMGDLFVLLFFGLVSVWGITFLFLGELNTALLYPAISYGLLATGVLNINNMRDIENDKASGKNTLVVLLGAKNARMYHALLILGAFLFSGLYLYELNLAACFSPSANPPDFRLRYLALLGFVPVIVNTIQVLKPKEHAADYNPFLKGLSLSALFQVIVFVSVLLYLIP
ncbi:MAG: 1,4-dihydroxy-2-naphthoate octaprenyltransferase [Bacteroidota bacterium]|nr:1,4-dihydroxy-2-naphthoate octaprenyltransferase [Bacteroidota bacterium]MDX5431851.1 1,4-dihydroxy-2-naphthoate octaprenyltransferase [Bacteroidota bacterium]MDX5470562.1 1,4-dihydroxy-2-naphthoate octaprenyltransferase [Bacteroidota bacterium]